MIEKNVPAYLKDAFLNYHSCYSNIPFPCTLEITFLNCKIFAKKGENKRNQQKLHNSVLKLLPPGLATWHGCFTEFFFWFLRSFFIFFYFFCFFLINGCTYTNMGRA